MTTDQLHDLMEQTCGPDLIGCCFSRRKLADVLQAQIKAIQANIDLIPPMETSFSNVSVSASLDSKTLNFTPGLKGIEVSISVVMYLRESGQPNDIYNEVEFDYKLVPMCVVQNPLYGGTLGFEVDTHNNQQPRFTSKSGDVDSNPQKQAVLKRNGISLAQYHAIENSVLGTTNAVAFITDFIEGLPFPTLVDAMRTFVIASPYKVVFDSDYYIITGRNDFHPTCSCASESVTSTSQELVLPKASSPGRTAARSLAAAAKMVPGTFEIGAPVPQTGTINAPNDPAYAFYYPKDVSFTVLSDSVLQPAIAASDSGKWLAFLWNYDAFCALKKGIAVNMDIPNAAVAIDFPLTIGGRAGSALRVGCVTVPLAQVDIVGSVDPSHLTLQFNIVNAPTGWKLIVIPSYASKWDVYFTGLPGLDVLLNILMGSFGNKLIAEKLGDRVARMQADLLQLGDIGHWNYQPYAVPNFRTKSVLVVLSERSQKRQQQKH